MGSSHWEWDGEEREFQAIRETLGEQGQAYSKIEYVTQGVSSESLEGHMTTPNVVLGLKSERRTPDCHLLNDDFDPNRFQSPQFSNLR